MNNTITVTPAAQQHLLSSIASSPAGTIGIRFGLRDAGCSGYAYTIDFTDTKAEDDHSFEFDGVNIIVSGAHLQSLAGTQIDYVKQGMNSLLSFNNPNVVDACGCGESFKFRDQEGE